MIKISASSPSSFSSPSSIGYNHIAGSSPSVLSPSRGFPEGLAAEVFTEIFFLVVFAIIRTLYDSFNKSQ